MKRILSLLLIAVMALGGIVASAETATLFSVMETPVFSACETAEFSMVLNKPFEFINDLIPEEDLADIPFDVKMLAESVCKFSETVDASFTASEDFKKMKLSATTQSTMPLEFGENFKTEVWAKVGMWMDYDFSDADNPVYKMIMRVPFNNKYIVIDFADVDAESEIQLEQFMEYIEKYTSEEYTKEMNAFIASLILSDMNVEETVKNSEYIISADDAAFKSIVKKLANKFYDVYSDALKFYEITGDENLRFQIEQYISVLDEIPVLGKDGLKIKVSLKDKKISSSEVSVHIDCNLYDAISAYGVDMSRFNRDKWQIDCVLSAKTVMEKINEEIEIVFPELTEENSENILEIDYGDYIPMYQTVYVHSSRPVIADANGSFMLSLPDAMIGFEIAKKYYTVDGDKVVIAPREGQYDFASATLTVGSDTMEVDGNSFTLQSPVSRAEDGTILVPVTAFADMTGYGLERISHSFKNDGLSGDGVTYSRKNPEYVEEEPYDDYMPRWINVTYDGAPIIRNDELYIPIRDLATQLGVADDGITVENGVITIVGNGEKTPEFTELRLTENSSVIYVDSNEISLANPVIELNGSAYAPLQITEFIGCRIENITYYFDNDNTRISLCREKLEKEEEYLPTYSKERYLTIEDMGNPVVIDNEYYLPLWPLMGELKIRAENIYETEENVRVISDSPLSGFSEVTLSGTSVTMDGNAFEMTKPMVAVDGKRYLPSEFITSVIGGEISGIYIWYADDAIKYRYSATVPNPVYEAPEDDK